MNAAQTIEFTRRFFPGWRQDLEKRFVREFELPLDRSVTKLSKGTLAKLHLLLAMSRGAEVVFLDEPTDGLDPVASEAALQAMVSAVAEAGTTVVFCTHRLNEIEQVCDHLTMIDGGRTLVDEPLDDLKLRTRRLVAVFDGAADEAAARLGARFPKLKKEGRTLNWMVRGEWEEAARHATALGALSVTAEAMSLRDLFLELAGRRAEDGQ
jgi:ABC-2 type transport system ATP-binding protein